MCQIAWSYRPVLLHALPLPCHPTPLVIRNSLQACLMVHSHSSALGKLAIIVALCFESLLGISSCNSRESRYCWEWEDASNEGVNIHFTGMMGRKRMAADYCWHGNANHWLGASLQGFNLHLHLWLFALHRTIWYKTYSGYKSLHTESFSTVNTAFQPCFQLFELEFFFFLPLSLAEKCSRFLKLHGNSCL